jgi:hypothetical protein
VVAEENRPYETNDMELPHHSITTLFDKLAFFALRLGSYRQVPLTKGMKTIIVKVLVNLLQFCALSQRVMRQGFLKARLYRWVKSIFMDDKSTT